MKNSIRKVDPVVQLRMVRKIQYPNPPTWSEGNNRKRKYYHKIIQQLTDADSFIILGPAEARVGLEKAIDGEMGLRSKLAAVMAEDSMTNNQVKAKVREYFRDN